MISMERVEQVGPGIGSMKFVAQYQGSLALYNLTFIHALTKWIKMLLDGEVEKRYTQILC